MGENIRKSHPWGSCAWRIASIAIIWDVKNQGRGLNPPQSSQKQSKRISVNRKENPPNLKLKVGGCLLINVQHIQ